MDLDFSHLTDDQLVELARLCCLEAVRRGDHISAAMRSMMIDEAERARIARAAAENEAAAIRARERERIAKDAAEQVRAEDEARNRSARQKRAAEAATVAAARAERTAEAERTWIRRFAAVVERRPGEISVLLSDTRYGRRVIVNLGCDRYTPDHLADHNLETGATKSTRELVKRKPVIAAEAAAMGAMNPKGTLFLCGANHDWKDDNGT